MIHSLTAEGEAGLDRFSDGVCNPDRPMLAEALAAASDRVNAARRRRPATRGRARYVGDVLEALDARLDAGWVADGRRLFVPASSELLPGSGWKVPKTSQEPHEAEIAVALAAAGQADVRVAEELALEAARSVVHAGAPRPVAVAWQLVRLTWPRSYWMSFCECVAYAAEARASIGLGSYTGFSSPASVAQRRVASRVEARLGGRPRWGVGPAWYAARCVRLWWLWRDMVDLGEVALGRGETSSMFAEQPRSVDLKPFSSMPDPLDAALRLASLGYWFIDTRGGVAIVGAVASFPPVSAGTWASVFRP